MSQTKSGFVLIELVTVVVIIVLLFTGAVISLNSFEGRNKIQTYRADLDEIQALIIKAHAYAQAGRFNDHWGIRRVVQESANCGASSVVNCFVLFKGNDYATRDTSYDEFVVYSSDLQRFSDDGNEEEIYFQRVTGWGKGFLNTLSGSETRFRFHSANGAYTCSIFLSLAGAVYNSCDADNWSYEREIVIQNGQVSGSTDLVNFPIFFSDTQADFKPFFAGGGMRQSDAGDARFVLPSGQELDHEIEVYDSQTGKLEAWVEIPSLSATADTTILIQYGNDGVGLGDKENISGVWDSNYVAVWHMSADPSIKTDGFCSGLGVTYYGCDSTDTNHFDSQPQYMTSSDLVTGKVGLAMDFDQWGDALEASDSSSLDSATGAGQARTWSFWINLVSNASNRSITDKTNSFTGGGGFWTERTADVISGGVAVSGGVVTGNIGNASWHHLAFSYDGSQTRLYVDGSLYDGPNSQTAPAANSNSFTIGGWAGASSPYAIIDEFRISNSARSTDWISTSYNNQNSTSTFYTIGSQQLL